MKNIKQDNREIKIKPQTISLTEYNSNPTKYGLLDTWIKFNKFGKEYFIKELKKDIKKHYKLFPNSDKPYNWKHEESGAFYDIAPEPVKHFFRSITVSEWITPKRKFKDIRIEQFNDDYQDFMKVIKGLSLHFDENRQNYIIYKSL